MSTPAKKQPIPFGKYLLLDRINIGGMAEVWRGKQFGASGFERLVAIKRILPNIAEDEEFIAMFIDEAKISVKLNHANIAQIYELGQIQSSYFIAMEYIPGKDMRAIFERCRKRGEPAPIPLTCYVVAKLCEGLDYAHRKKDDQGRDMVIVHRDVSPQNVLMSYEGEVKVIDFGIAKAAGKATKTQAGILKGKFGYMSPEQIRGLPLDQRSDVFAIGVCLYEMLTGERLFVGDSDFSVLEKVRKADVLPPSTYNRRIPETLEKIVLKALARDVDERYQYASELADDLQRFLITSDSIFSRKDLMQYMKSTFAEEVEREKVRIQEYAEVQPLPGMVEDGSSPMQRSQTQPAPSQRAPATSQPLSQSMLPKVPAASQVLSQSALPQNPGNAATRELPSPTAVRRTASLTSLPKLTAAAAAPTPQDDNGATIISDGQSPLSHQNAPPPAPSATNLPKLTAAAAAPTNQDDNGATVLSAGPEEATGPIDGPEPTTLHDDDRTAALARLPRMPPSVDPRLTRPPPPSPPRGAPAFRPSDTEPELGMPEASLPTPMNRPPVLRPMGESPTLESGPPRLMPSERPAPPMLSPFRGAPPPQPQQEDDAPPRFRPQRAPYQPPPVEEEPSEQVPRAPLRNRNAMLAILGGVAVVVLIAVLLVVLRSPSKGFIIVNIMPSEVRGKAHLFVNGVARGLPAKWPAAIEAPLGPAVVMISVDGYEPFTRTVDVKESGAEVPSVQWDIPARNPSTPLVVVTEPSDAEVRIDGETVKKEGVSEPYLGETAVGSRRKIEVTHAGYRARTEVVTADGPPLKVMIPLDRLDSQPVSITSEPSGAVVTANGKPLGVTPTSAKLSADVQSITLSKKCYESTDVAVQLPANPGNSPLELRGTLRKQPGCR